MAVDESRPFIFSFVMFVCYLLLLSLFPVELYAHSYTQHEYNIPPYFEGLELGAYDISTNFTLDDAQLSTQILGIRLHDWALGGYDWRIVTDLSYTYLMMGKRNQFGIWLISTDFVEFISDSGSNRGDQLSRAEMNEDYVATETWIHYRISIDSQPEVSCEVYLGFNTTAYSTPGEAFANQSLTFLQTMGLDDLYTSLNVWVIMGRLMFMQMPDIHPLLNLILIAPIWANIVWSILIIFTKLIPGL